MAIVSVPKVTFDITVLPQAVDNAPQRLLYLGQQVTDSSTDAILVKNIQPNGQEDILFGRQSMLAGMIRAFRTINTLSQVDAIPLNDAGGSVQATGSVTFVGTANATGTITIFIQSKVIFQFDIAVTTGDTPTVIGDALETAVNNNDSILVTAANVTGTVTLTAVHGGKASNEMTVGGDSITSGSDLGVTTTFAKLQSGDTDPDISTILAQIGDIRYQTLVYPATYLASPNADTIVDFLNARFNPTNAVEDGVGISTKTESQSSLEAEASGLNSQSIVYMGNKRAAASEQQGGALFEFDPVISSYVAAIRTLRLTDGANIANLLVGSAGSGNNFGGIRLAAVPYHNTPVSNVATIETELGWSRTEQDSLNSNGVGFLGNNSATNGVIFGDMVTTKQNDASFKFLNAVDTASNIREFFFNNNKQNYAQSVLTPGDIIPNSNQVDTASFNAFQLKLYTELSLAPFTLTVAGSAATTFFKDNITTTINFVTGTISTIMIVPILSQVRTIDGTLEIAFDISIA